MCSADFTENVRTGRDLHYRNKTQTEFDHHFFLQSLLAYLIFRLPLFDLWETQFPLTLSCKTTDLFTPYSTPVLLCRLYSANLQAFPPESTPQGHLEIFFFLLPQQPLGGSRAKREISFHIKVHLITSLSRKKQ